MKIFIIFEDFLLLSNIFFLNLFKKISNKKYYYYFLIIISFFY